jgi:hypothetical protein
MDEIAKRLADEHWIYVCSICEKMYKDAFIHGYKHGVKSKKEE